MTPKVEIDKRMYNGQRSWDDETEAMLRKIWPQGLSAAQSANAINAAHGTRFSRSAVIAKVHRLGISAFGRARVTPLARPSHSRPPVSLAGRTEPKLINGLGRNESAIAARKLQVELGRTGGGQIDLPASPIKVALISAPQKPYMALSSRGRMEQRVSGPDGNDIVIAAVPDRTLVTLLDLPHGHCKMVVSEAVTGQALFCGCACDRGRKGRFDPYCATHTASIKSKASPPIDLRGTGIDAIKPRARSMAQIGRRFNGL